MPELSQQLVKPGVRRIPREERDEERDLSKYAFANGGTDWQRFDLLEKKLLRVLADVREQRQELLTRQPVTKRKTRESVPAIVNLIFVCFPAEYAE